MNVKSSKIGIRLFSGFILLVAIIVAIGALSIHEFKKYHETIESIYDSVVVPNQFISKALMLNERMRTNLRDAVRQSDAEKIEDKIQSVENFKSELEDNLSEFEKRLTITEERGQFQEFQTTKKEYWDAIKKIEELARQGKDEEAYQEIDKGTALIANSFRDGIQSFVDMKDGDGKKMVEDANLLMKKDSKIMMIFIIVGAFLGLISALFIARSVSSLIVKPVVNFNKGFSDVAYELSTISTNLLKAGGHLSQTTADQASSVEEMTASMEEISKMVESNQEKSEHSVVAAQDVLEQTGIGVKQMERLIASMQEILVANDKIQNLTRLIMEIATKTALIDEIVFQTKLLSFNASVEAERAGEHGRGFAVVAQEVGNLAQMSGKAALEISEIVRRGKSESEQITANNKEKVEQQHKIVTETDIVLKEIRHKAEIINSLIQEVVIASKEQSVGVVQCTEASQQIDKMVQENAREAEQANELSQQISTNIATLQQKVEELSRIIS